MRKQIDQIQNRHDRAVAQDRRADKFGDVLQKSVERFDDDLFRADDLVNRQSVRRIERFDQEKRNFFEMRVRRSDA